MSKKAKGKKPFPFTREHIIVVNDVLRELQIKSSEDVTETKQEEAFEMIGSDSDNRRALGAYFEQYLGTRVPASLIHPNLKEVSA